MIKIKLQDLIEQTRSNHYKMLVIVDNSKQFQKVIDALSDKDYSAYDVNENILKLVEEIPLEKVKLRIGSKIKEWVKSMPDKVLLYNTTILYSPEFGRLSPIGAFKYKAREKEIILLIEGHISGDTIRYSDYGRDDYAEMDVSDLIHVRTEDINV